MIPALTIVFLILAFMITVPVVLLKWVGTEYDLARTPCTSCYASISPALEKCPKCGAKIIH